MLMRVGTLGTTVGADPASATIMGASDGVAHAHLVDRPGALAAIDRDGVNLAIWTRRLNPRLRAWIGALDLTALKDGRWDLPLAGLPRRLTAGLTGIGLPAGPGRALLAADLARLACLLSRRTGCWAVTVRLESVDHDACRRFHADNVPVRLITTYAGPGTQWLDDTGAERRLRQMQPGHVGLFKGDAWPGNRGRGILHRSPPVEGTGRRRLLAVIDIAE